MRAGHIGPSGDLGEEAGVFPGLAHRGCEDLRGLSRGGDEGRRKKGLLIREFTAGCEPFGGPGAPTTAGSWTSQQAVLPLILQAGKLRLKVTGSHGEKPNLHPICPGLLGMLP